MYIQGRHKYRRNENEDKTPQQTQIEDQDILDESVSRDEVSVSENSSKKCFTNYYRNECVVF